MSAIFHFPIEPLEARYSVDWWRWWREHAWQVDPTGRDWTFVAGDRLEESIARGEFLDAYDTHHWKATQLARFAKYLHLGRVKAGDWVVLHDGWNPAVEQLAYMRAVGGVAFKIALVLHAGTWDPHDHLTKVGMRPWAQHAEAAWARAADLLLFATDFHRRLFLSGDCGRPTTEGVEAKCVVTGFPLYARTELASHARPWAEREKLVVFPHRLAPEKDPAGFADLERLYRARYGADGSTWVRTKDVCATKAEYHALLGRARCAVSTARQETWGIAMLESVALGAWPVAPARLAYPETLAGFKLYHRLEDAVEMVRGALYEEPAAAPALGFARWERALDAIHAELAAR